jgi:hypothetical protein
MRGFGGETTLGSLWEFCRMGFGFLWGSAQFKGCGGGRTRGGDPGALGDAKRPNGAC